MVHVGELSDGLRLERRLLEIQWQLDRLDGVLDGQLRQLEQMPDPRGDGPEFKCHLSHLSLLPGIDICAPPARAAPASCSGSEGNIEWRQGHLAALAPAVPCNCGVGCLGERTRMGKSTHHGPSCWPGIGQVSQLRAFEQIVATHRTGSSTRLQPVSVPQGGDKGSVGTLLRCWAHADCLTLACHTSETCHAENRRI